MQLLRKLRYAVLLGLVGICFAQLQIPGEATIYNNDQKQYLDDSDISNPIRDGAYTAIKSPDAANKIEGVQGEGDKIEDHATAKSKTLQLVKNMINYALGLVSLIALIYMIYHGIIVITAAGDDAKYKEGMKGIKFAAIALIGIGFSWIFVSTIFWFINNVLIKG